jgi:hypothetical protein
MRRAIAIFVAVVGLALLAGCGNDGAGGSAPTTDSSDQSPAAIIAMPDRWDNIAIKCDGPNRVYESANDGGLFVVKDDPRCKGGPS